MKNLDADTQPIHVYNSNKLFFKPPKNWAEMSEREKQKWADKTAKLIEKAKTRKNAN